jgi:hypothetical protein
VVRHPNQSINELWVLAKSPNKVWNLISLHISVLGDWNNNRFQLKIRQDRMEIRQAMKTCSQTALQPPQAKLKQTQIAFMGWVDLATGRVALLQDKLTQFVTPKCSDCDRQ